MSHRFALRVYYEDTDLAGIVYYANYLKFIERARSEWVRGLGVDQARLRAESGIVFAVRRVEADYLRPAVFDDLLEVETRLVETGGARILPRSGRCAAVRSGFSRPAWCSCASPPTGVRRGFRRKSAKSLCRRPEALQKQQVAQLCHLTQMCWQSL